jgi:hypothetical protein
MKKSTLQTFNNRIIIIICIVFLASIALIGLFKLDTQTTAIMGAFGALCLFAGGSAVTTNARKGVREAMLSYKNPEVVKEIITKGMEKE